MTTIVVHGTMTVRAATHYSWWWNSWHDGGFLDALSDGMQRITGNHDVWRVNGRNVSEVPELNPEWSFWTGRMGQISQHKGHFIWSGADMGVARDAGAAQLADYLNQISEITGEHIRIVAHSHGCNLVKRASSHRRLSHDVVIDRAVFLACPHFSAPSAGDTAYSYRLAPHRFHSILNLYSLSDTVQVGIADAIAGPPGARFADYLPPTASRIDQDPETDGLYEDYQIATAAEGVQAHTVMHGSLVGGLSGLWLNGEMPFTDIVDRLPMALPAVPAEDDGA